jgi:hypothetical protein
MSRGGRPELKILRAAMAHVAVRAAPSTFTFHILHAGVPDFLSVRDGRLFALFAKAGDTQLTYQQHETIAALHSAGAAVAVAESASAAIDLLERWRMLEGRRQ